MKVYTDLTNKSEKESESEKKTEWSFIAFALYSHSVLLTH